MKTPREFISETIMGHEGGLSIDRNDVGNWFLGKLVGSKYGVTGSALAAYRKWATISGAQMADLTREEAIEIALSLYYDKPNIDLLAWNPVTASVLDMGYNAGPTMAIKLLQRLIAVGDDGQIGAMTASAYGQWVHGHGVETAAQKYCEAREAHYEAIIRARPANAKYHDGWRNRARSFLPGTPWWKGFGA